MFHVVNHDTRSAPARRRTVAKENALQDINFILLNRGEEFYEEGVETTHEQLHLLDKLQQFPPVTGEETLTVRNIFAKNVYCNYNNKFLPEYDDTINARGDFVIKYNKLPCSYQQYHYLAGDMFKVIKGETLVKICGCTVTHDDEGQLNTPTTYFDYISESEIKRSFSFMDTATTPILDAIHDLKLLYKYRLRVYKYGIYWEPEYTQKGKGVALIKRNENIFLKPVDSNKKLLLCLYCKNVIKKAKNSFSSHQSHLRQHDYLADSFELGSYDHYQDQQCTRILRIAERNGLVDYMTYLFGHNQTILTQRHYVKSTMESMIILYQKTIEEAVSNSFTNSFLKNKDLIPVSLFHDYKMVRNILSQRGVSISACSADLQVDNYSPSSFNAIIFRTNFYCDDNENLQIYKGHFYPSYTNDFLGIKSFVQLPDGTAIQDFNNFESNFMGVKRNMGFITTDRGSIRSARQKYCSENGMGSISCGIHIINCCLQLLTSKYYFRETDFEDTIVETVTGARNYLLNSLVFDYTLHTFDDIDTVYWDNSEQGNDRSVETLDDDIQVKASLEDDIEAVGEINMNEINPNGMYSDEDDSFLETFTLKDLESVTFTKFKPMLKSIIRKIKNFNKVSTNITENFVSDTLLKTEKLYEYYSMLALQKHALFGFSDAPRTMYRLNWDSAADTLLIILENKNNLLQFAHTVTANGLPETALEFNELDFLVYELFFLMFRIFQRTTRILGTFDTTIFYYQHLIINYCHCQQLFCFELASINGLSWNSVDSFFESMSKSMSDCTRSLEANLADQLRYDYIKHHIDRHGLESYKKNISEKLILYISSHYSEINFLDADSQLTSTLIKKPNGSSEYEYAKNASTANRQRRDDNRRLLINNSNAVYRSCALPLNSSAEAIANNQLPRERHSLCSTSEDSYLEMFIFENPNRPSDASIDCFYTRTRAYNNYLDGTDASQIQNSTTNNSLVAGVLHEVAVMVEKIKYWGALFFEKHGSLDESNIFNKIRLNSYLYSQYQRAFPDSIISAILKDLFSCLPTSVEVQRLFSTTNFYHQNHGNRMKARNFTNIMNCKNIEKVRRDKALDSTWSEIKEYVNQSFSYREPKKPKPVALQTIWSG